MTIITTENDTRTSKRNMIPKEAKLYYIEWIDSYSPIKQVWERISELETPQNLICVSVGWIIKQNKDYITICPHISDITNKDFFGEVCGIMNIPQKAIKKKKILIP